MANIPNYIFYDLETGGLNPIPKLDKKGEEIEPANPITEIALIVVDGVKLKQIETYTTYVQPYHNLTITENGLKFSSVTMNDVESGIKATDLIKTLIELFKKHKVAAPGDSGFPILVGHNNRKFDDYFLNELFKLHGKNVWDYVGRNTDDTMNLARIFWNHIIQKDTNDKINLTECCKRAGIKLTNAHSAENDAIATLKLFRYFTNIARTPKEGNSKPGVIEATEDAKARAFFRF
jgi:DNA polymerase III epsilon subunit-like protein